MSDRHRYLATIPIHRNGLTRVRQCSQTTPRISSPRQAWSPIGPHYAGDTWCRRGVAFRTRRTPQLEAVWHRVWRAQGQTRPTSGLKGTQPELLAVLPTSKPPNTRANPANTSRRAKKVSNYRRITTEGVVGDLDKRLSGSPTPSTTANQSQGITSLYDTW